jgi:hypothetical protein
MARKLEPAAFVFLKGETIYIILVAQKPGKNGLIRATEIFRTRSASAPPQQLGADIRKALDEFRVFKTAKEYDEYPDLAERMAGGADKLEEFEKDLGAVTIETSAGVSGFAIAALTPDNEVMDGTLEFIECDCSDAELGKTVLMAAKTGARRRSGNEAEEEDFDSLEEPQIAAAPAKKPKKPTKKKSKAAFKRPAGDKGLAADLDKLGFFSIADDPAAAYAHVKEDGWVGAMLCESGRCFFADAEELAEGGAGETLGEIAAFFSAIGVKAPEIEGDSEDEGYMLLIDGKPYPILKPADVRKEDSKPGYTWGIATFRTAETVNALLAKHKLAERCYAIEGGNQGYFLLITPEMYKTITSAKGYEPKHGPYVMTDKYSSFGQPRR